LKLFTYWITCTARRSKTT